MGTVTGLTRRARHEVAHAREVVASWRAPGRTALRLPPAVRPPPPGRFAAFGDGSWIVPPATVTGVHHITIGERVVVMEHGSLVAVEAPDGGAPPRLVLGDGVILARFVSITAEREVIIEDDVLSSDNVTITDSWLGRLADRRPTAMLAPPPPAPVVVERGAYLAMNCVIGPGVRVGAGAFVGEGAVVLADVAPHSVVYGNPATELRHHDAATGTWHGTDPHVPAQRARR
ncbi:acyltransferase [soil metagenome]